MRSEARLPVCLVTGFLGAGKTTLLKQIVAANRERRLVYLVNEFSVRDIDGLDVAAEGADVIPVPGGSIFCTCLVTEFIGRLRAIMSDYGPVEGVVIEASGMANPKVVQTMLNETGLNEAYDLRTIITVVEPGSYLKLVHTLPNVTAQVEAADLVLINKSDLYDDARVQQTEAHVRSANPNADIRQTVHGRTEIDIFGTRQAPRRIDGEYALCRDPNYDSCVLTFSAPTDAHAVAAALREHADDIYRAKGFVPDPQRGMQRVSLSAGNVTVEACDDHREPHMAVIARGASAQDVRTRLGTFGAVE